jgi:dephospho-CoA kinase
MLREGQARCVLLHVFGLTGGLASGKGLVSARFAARGVPVINADDLSREAVRPGSPGLADIVAAFGAEVLEPSGGLDRRKLGARVFADPDARRRLEALTHPRIHALMLERTAELARRGEPLACYEAPILVEVGLTDKLRPLVVVAASEATQVARAMQRDGLSEAAVRARMAAQLPLAEKVRVADHVIDNDGSRETTLAAADRVLDAISRTLSIPVERYPVPTEA